MATVRIRGLTPLALLTLAQSTDPTAHLLIGPCHLRITLFGMSDAAIPVRGCQFCGSSSMARLQICDDPVIITLPHGDIPPGS